MQTQKTINFVALVLVIIGAVNWGLVGLADLDIVTTIFGIGSIAKVVYALIGLSGIYSLTFVSKLK